MTCSFFVTPLQLYGGTEANREQSTRVASYEVKVRKPSDSILKGRALSEEFLSCEYPQRPIDPASIHREICVVTNQLVISGDLPSNYGAKFDQLDKWVDAGITDVIDVREERDDSEFIRSNSDITPYWLGVDDCGSRRDPAWFMNLTAITESILADSQRKLLIHCHMGVNRGPSAAFAALIHHGWHHLDALRAIRRARPITGIIYAPDAAEWHGLHSTGCPTTALEWREDVEAWLDRHPLDLRWVISSIGRRTAA